MEIQQRLKAVQAMVRNGTNGSNGAKGPQGHVPPFEADVGYPKWLLFVSGNPTKMWMIAMGYYHVFFELLEMVGFFGDFLQ